MMGVDVLTPDCRVFPFWWEDAPPSPADADVPARADVAVIGAGYCGLMAALALAENGIKAVVLDAGDPGTGASTRNHGHVGGVGKLPAKLAQQVGAERAPGDDLDADSLDLVELVMGLEEEFQVSVDEEELEGVETVGQAYDLIVSKL